ncbi:1-phosphatidylinositol-4,5-bisphosphate phosphodiesterase 1 [Fusarium bulbicola]|nr:1-phosphatidylinositol-4,5-bisphosphate phosphodiesterase 1 [Fusarium bulbicola]
MPPQSRAPGSLSQRRPENTQKAEAADMNRHRTDQRRANLEKIARYIIHPLSQSPYKHVGMDFLNRCRIKCKGMHFKTGQVGKQTEQFIQPIPPKVVQQWLDETRQPPKERRDIVNEYSHEFPNDNQWEATMIWRRINAYLSESENAQGSCVMTTHTQWHHAKPHAICYLADGAELVDDMLLTSELTTLLLMATDTALKATWQKHKLIPVWDYLEFFWSSADMSYFE